MRKIAAVALAASMALAGIAPVSASETEHQAIYDVIGVWVAADTRDAEIAAELEIATLAAEAVAPECQNYAGYALSLMALYNEYVITESLYLSNLYHALQPGLETAAFDCQNSL